MSEVALPDVDTKCLNCGEPVHIAAVTAWKDHKMTLRYELEEGHMMTVEEFADSIKGLARALKLVGKDLGQKIVVQIAGLSVENRALEITVLAVRSTK